MSVNDLANREERPPYVQFETRAVENKRESLAQGMYVAEDIDYALITPAYSKDRVEKTVTAFFEHQERNIRSGRGNPKWLQYWKDSYKAYKEGNEIPENGTPIRDWGSISPAQRQMILSAGIRTIEDLAMCNDEGLKRLGMGGRDLVQKAKSWLKSVTDYGQISMQNAQLLKENEQYKLTVSSLEEKVNELAKMVESKHNTEPVEVPRETISVSDILDEPSLEDQYQAKFGKKPHWKMKEETIRAKLEE